MIIASGPLPAPLPRPSKFACVRTFRWLLVPFGSFPPTSGAFSLAARSVAEYFYSILGGWEWRLSFSTWCPIEWSTVGEMSPIVLVYYLPSECCCSVSGIIGDRQCLSWPVIEERKWTFLDEVWMGRSRAATLWLPALALVLLLAIGVLAGFFALFYRVSVIFNKPLKYF